MVHVVRRTKVETTYELVPLIGELLGYWRKVYVNRLGSRIGIHLNRPLEEYDELFINREKIELKTPTLERG